MCGLCKTACVRCSAAFGALRWSGVGVRGFSVHLYFCMFLLSVYGAVAPRFWFCEVMSLLKPADGAERRLSALDPTTTVMP